MSSHPSPAADPRKELPEVMRHNGDRFVSSENSMQMRLRQRSGKNTSKARKRPTESRDALLNAIYQWIQESAESLSDQLASLEIFLNSHAALEALEEGEHATRCSDSFGVSDTIGDHITAYLNTTRTQRVRVVGADLDTSTLDRGTLACAPQPVQNAIRHRPNLAVLGLLLWIVFQTNDDTSPGALQTMIVQSAARTVGTLYREALARQLGGSKEPWAQWALLVLKQMRIFDQQTIQSLPGYMPTGFTLRPCTRYLGHNGEPLSSVSLLHRTAFDFLSEHVELDSTVETTVSQAICADLVDGEPAETGHQLEMHTSSPREDTSTPPGREQQSPKNVPPGFRTVSIIYEQAREDLENLRADIRDLQYRRDESDILSQSSRSENEDPFSTRRIPQADKEHEVRNAAGNAHDEPDAPHGDRDDRCTDTASSRDSGGPSAGRKAHNYKRSRLEDANDEEALTEVGLRQKRARLPRERFICCFHDGPGRKCSGTDDTISDVIRKLSEKHDTHVCNRCWTLTMTEEDLDVVHGVTCRAYCLSPRCHKTTSTIGHRHEFHPKSCGGSKTARAKPADRVAIYRFIYTLVHPKLEIPTEVCTSRRSGHFDSVSRQSRCKPTQEELTDRIDRLEKQLEEGDKQNDANVLQNRELELKLEKATERIEKLEKEKRRIVIMLSDALRTGVFSDRGGHLSLRERVKDDAPDALNFESQPLLTPTTSSKSPRPSTMPSRDDADLSGQGQTRTDVGHRASNQDACIQPDCNGSVSQNAPQRGDSEHGMHRHDTGDHCGNGSNAHPSTAQPAHEIAATGIEGTVNSHIVGASGNGTTGMDGSSPAAAEHQTLALRASSMQREHVAPDTDFQDFNLADFNFAEWDKGMLDCGNLAQIDCVSGASESPMA